MPYVSSLFLSNIERLHQRRADAGKTFFDGVCQETSCLNHLLPDKRDPHIISKMRHPIWYLITALNVISLSYIMPQSLSNTIILCVFCVDLYRCFVSLNVLWFDGQYCIVLWTLLHSLCTLLHFLYYYVSCMSGVQVCSSATETWTYAGRRCPSHTSPRLISLAWRRLP